MLVAEVVAVALDAPPAHFMTKEENEDIANRKICCDFSFISCSFCDGRAKLPEIIFLFSICRCFVSWYWEKVGY